MPKLAQTILQQIKKYKYKIVLEALEYLNSMQLSQLRLIKFRTHFNVLFTITTRNSIQNINYTSYLLNNTIIHI